MGGVKSRCVHVSPAVSSCARTYSGQRPGRTNGPLNRLSPVAPLIRGPFGGCTCPLKDHRWLSFWPTHSPQNPSAGAASPAVPGSASEWPSCCRPGERCDDQCFAGLCGLSPWSAMQWSPPGRPSGASACRHAGSRCVCGPLMDLPSACGGPGMYPAIWHRCWREVKYQRHLRIDTAEDRRCREPGLGTGERCTKRDPSVRLRPGCPRLMTSRSQPPRPAH